MTEFPREYLPYKNVLGVFAHMDDETVLALGTLLKLKREFNCNIHLLVACNLGRINSTKYEQEHRLLAYTGLKDEYEFNVISPTWEYHDLEISNNNQFMPMFQNTVSNVSKERNIDLVITHSNKDIHSDHRTVHECVMVGLRRLNPKLNHYPSAIWTTMSIVNQTAFNQFGTFTPNKFIDISKYVEHKMYRYEFYGSELTNEWDDLRNSNATISWLEHYGRPFGAMCEPFEVVYEVM